jgi:peptide/nickel transport system substrate-binding protein
MDELPLVYICNYGVAYGFNEKVQNFKFNPTAHDYMWNTDITITE